MPAVTNSAAWCRLDMMAFLSSVARPYVLLTQPRDGSSMLCEALRQERKTHCDGELLSLDPKQGLRRKHMIQRAGIPWPCDALAGAFALGWPCSRQALPYLALPYLT